MSVLSWEQTTLGGVAEVVGGATPKTSVDEYWDGDVYWVTPKDLSGLEGAEIASTPRTLTQAGLRSCSARVLPTGSVLLSSRAPIGQVAINTVPMATNQGFKSLIPNRGRVDAKFLYWWLRCNRPALEAMGTGATFKEISKKTTAAVPIQLPPIEEQRRIAAVLDAADGLRAKRREALAKLDSLTQSIFIDMFGDPLRGWPEPIPLGSLVDFVGGGTPTKSRSEFFEGTTCWATSKDMRGAYLDDTQDHITQEAIDSSATKLVAAGTVLVVVKSKVLAHTLPVAIARVPTCFGQDLKGLVPRDGLTSEFVAASLRAAAPWLLRQARGVNTEGLTLEQLRRAPGPPHSPGSVAQFTSATQGVSAAIEGAKRQETELDGLFASLQQRAFRGEL